MGSNVQSEQGTTTIIGWISFPSLPLNFFSKGDNRSLTVTVGKLLKRDTARKNQTRPNCVRVKVELDLLQKFLKCIKIGVRKKNNDVNEM